MKKLKIFLLLTSFIAVTAIAQKKPVKTSVDKPDENTYHALMLGPGLGLWIKTDSNNQWINSAVGYQPNSNYVFLKGTKSITMYGYLPKDSADQYRYNIIENNNKFLATNAKPIVSEGAERGKYNRVELNLGTYNIENKKLKIEFFKINSSYLVQSTTIYNKEIEPAKISIVSRVTTNKKGNNIESENLKDGFKFKINDTSIVNSLYVVTKPTDVSFIYTFYIKNIATGKRELINNGIYNYINVIDQNGISSTPFPSITINASFFNEPGYYELQIVPQLSNGYRVRSFPEKTTTFRFTVLPSDTVLQAKTVIKYVVIGLIVIACLIFIVFYTNRKRNKKLLAEQKQQKDMAQLQLEAVRSQLNPHFLFNALAGIQNLINKTDTDEANRYLTKFARLTRNVLNNKDLINLSDEKVLLDDYLQMEQMRYGFKYDINVDSALDISNLQIPSMLLQPFAENAVKHGLPNDESTGKIIIGITKKDNDLELSIADNGKGFSQQKDGMGLQLSKKRIALLNTIYKDSPIRLDVQSGTDGTVVKITLTHWL